MLLAALAASAAAPEFPEVEGWSAAGKAQHYDRETLFEVIDGAAELYFSYGFVGLRMRDLSRGERRVTVGVYDMGEPINAFGIFHKERPASAPALAAGAEAALVASYQCLMVKDRFYAKTEALQGQLDAATCRALLVPLAAALPGTDAPPAELALLPAAGREAGSIGFTRRNFLGSAALSNCVHARYLRKGQEPLTVFAVLPPPGGTLASVWQGLTRGREVTRAGAHPTVAWAIPYRGTVVLVRGPAGIRGAVDTGDAAAVLASLRRAIAPPAR